MFYSHAKQDEFVANLFNFKKDGFYIDIGSCDSKNGNNSYYFDQLGWTGVCVELNSGYSDLYSDRKNCKLIIGDATYLNYEEIFNKHSFPQEIDYASVDIDTHSLDVLKVLPFNKYDFKVITIEHDGYLYQDQYRLPQREFLTGLGYKLICSNVFVEQNDFDRKECPFEDWYINPKYFDTDLIIKIQSESEYPSKIIEKFGRK